MHSRFIHRSWSLLLAGLGQTACVEDQPVEVAQTEFRGGSVNYPVVACNSANVIGELDDPNTDCEANLFDLPEDWDIHGLFYDYNPELAQWHEMVPEAMRTFCVFEYVGEAPLTGEEGQYEDLFFAIDHSNVMNIETVEVDCLGQQTMGAHGLDTEEVHEALEGRYHDAIDWVSSADLGTSHEYRVFPEIAILDTVSQLGHKGEYEPVNMHGEFMGDIVADITCPHADPPDPDCLESIHHHVSMPRVDFAPRDYEVGGQHGTMGDLATALVAAVGLWRDARIEDETTTPRLVISLSLGWDPSLNDETRAPYRALELALKFAACNGAIVVAASGNVADPTCPIDTGPLAPAIFEEVAAPDEQECDLLGFEPLDELNYPVFYNDRPLVYAVGGVDVDDRPIINARPDSTPPLVAYASNVTVMGEDDEYTLPLTGTSVSAAQVAAIAGLAWSYAPWMTPDQIMTAIYITGEYVAPTADFSFVPNSSVNRASVCWAVKEVCGVLECPVMDCEPRGYDLDGAIEDAINNTANTVERFEADEGVEASELQCDPQLWDQQTDPQPEHPICPECVIHSPDDTEKGNDDLDMSIKSEYKGLVDGITLLTEDASHHRMVYQFSSAIVASVNSPTVNITHVDMDVPGTVSANLTFHIITGSSQDGPITVTH